MLPFSPFNPSSFLDKLSSESHIDGVFPPSLFLVIREEPCKSDWGTQKVISFRFHCTVAEKHGRSPIPSQYSYSISGIVPLPELRPTRDAVVRFVKAELQPFYNR
jgi:hypothetical protein